MVCFWDPGAVAQRPLFWRAAAPKTYLIFAIRRVFGPKFRRTLVSFVDGPRTLNTIDAGRPRWTIVDLPRR
jgi:hypothetical protein